MWLHYEDKSAFGISQVSHGEVDMTKYKVEKIENGVATLRYPNNSWSEVLLARLAQQKLKHSQKKIKITLITQSLPTPHGFKIVLTHTEMLLVRSNT